MPWFRLFNEMPNDPKWRVIARKSGRTIAEVQAVYLQLLSSASANADRGTASISSEDIAAALDIEIENVDSIREAMQGRVLEGDEVTGWRKRNPAREDDSAERTREYRKRKQYVTQCDAEQKHVTQCDARGEERREELSTSPSRVREAERPFPATGQDPDAGAELTLAAALFDELAVPSDFGTRDVAADAIRQHAKATGGVKQAFEQILAAARSAKIRGETINRFWFTDQRYNPAAQEGGTHGNSQRGAAHERVTASKRALDQALAKRGIDSSGGDAGPDGGPVPAPGPGGFDGGLPVGLRAVGYAVLDGRGGTGVGGMAHHTGGTVLPATG